MKIQKNTPFWDNSLPIEKRLDWLIEEMTIEEKLDCLASKVPDIERLGIPAMSVGGEAAHGVEARNDQNELGDPEPTTSFVQPIGMSATWNPELIRQAGEVTGIETRVIYHRHPDRGLSRWAPTVDLERDPRWGRTEEGYGEDPFLTGEMASAYIKGMQGEHPQYLRVATTLKHFYANNTEDGRGWKNSSIDPRNKYEFYIEPFRRAIEKGGAEAVMTAYNKINGIPGILNSEVQDILKEQYGLNHAVSDGGAMVLVAGQHHYFGTHAETLAASLKAGVDAMSDDPRIVSAAAKEAWELGILNEKDVDRSIRNMFRTKLRLGIYDKNGGNPFDNVTEEDILSEKNKEICHQVSREAVVLLKNHDDTLPISKEKVMDIALIGPMANNWYPDWYGGKAPFAVTLKQGMEEITGEKVESVDGLDHIVFRYKEKGIAIAEDGTLYLGEKPDIFVKEDWGEESFTFRSVRTGKYMNTRFDMNSEKIIGRIAAERENTLDWFVLEKFGLKYDENGNVILLNRFEKQVNVREDGSLWADGSGKEIAFSIEKVSDGLQEAIMFAKQKEIVVLALGCNSMINAKEEIDRSTIALPPVQEKLAEKLFEMNKKVIVILMSNYPYAVENIQVGAKAIIWSATGAQDMGLALAETIFGINPPAGRLNLTWYKSDEQLPNMDDYDIIKGERTYRYFDGEVTYPFGYGLTYGNFTYSNLMVKNKNEFMLDVMFDVRNNGKFTSDEVVQIYGTAPLSRVKKPLRQLLGFKRLKNVSPGECRTVHIEVPIQEFAFYDVISRKMIVESGKYKIFVGTSSKAELNTQVDIVGASLQKRNLTDKIAADHYDDYENIILKEGKFGYSAVTINNREKVGLLIYKNNIFHLEKHIMVLHMRSKEQSCVEIIIDGKCVGEWKGNTKEHDLLPGMSIDSRREKDRKAMMKSWNPVYTDIQVPLNMVETCLEKDRELVLSIKGDMELCYFYME